MLETVSQGFRAAKNLLKGQAQLTQSNIEEALREVRTSLLSADVEYGVVKGFLGRVKQKALGLTVSTSTTTKQGQKLKLSPSEHFIGICYEELEALMGPVDTAINLSRPIGSIMMVGLQGSGKTTTTGKLAIYLKKKGFRPLLVAADIYRPAAIDQLKILGQSIGVPVYSDLSLAPPQLCKHAFQKAKEHQCNVVIFDTAGRLAIDEQLMQELDSIKQLTMPDNIFLVVDAMIGQDAVKTAAEFNKRLSIDGFILTKLDGDARGGAALSIKEVTQKPIKFLGMGEQLSALEEFRPEGLASRILGMGDIVGLVKDFEEHVDQEKAEKDAERMLRGQLTLQDFLEQLKMIKKMGSFSDILEKLPGMSDLMPKDQSIGDSEITKFESIVLSMTAQERKRPDLITKQKTRKKRIALGSGRKESDVDTLVQRFSMMKQMMQAVNMQPGLLGRLPGFKQMGQMAQLAKAYGGGGKMPMDIGSLMNAMPRGNRPLVPPPGYFSTTSVGGSSANKTSSKDKKLQRKREKAARKKNKKR